MLDVSSLSGRGGGASRHQTASDDVVQSVSHSALTGPRARTSSTCGILPIGRTGRILTRSLKTSLRYGSPPPGGGSTPPIIATRCAVCGIVISPSIIGSKTNRLGGYEAGWWVVIFMSCWCYTVALVRL